MDASGAAVWASVAGDSAEKLFGAIAGFGIGIAQETPFRGQTLVVLFLLFLIWVNVKEYIVRYMKRMKSWEEHWEKALRKVIDFLTYLVFFLLSSYVVFILREEWAFGNLNIQEIATIYIVFIVMFIVVSLIYSTRLRDEIKNKKKKNAQK
jgi:p-aminobenzoyl-glutamate transporter AbgT